MEIYRCGSGHSDGAANLLVHQGSKLHFPKDETALATRRELQYKALGACAGLADHFRYCLETLCETDLNGSPKNLVERFGKICEKINKLVDVLKGWQASDTVRTPKE